MPAPNQNIGILRTETSEVCAILKMVKAETMQIKAREDGDK